MEHKLKIRSINTIIILLCLLLFMFVAYRAYYLSFTHDESLSYTITKGSLVWKDTANNHLLNTEMMKVSSNLLGDNEFPLRLPNVILFIVYLFFCYRIIKQSENLWIMLLGAVLLLFNPFMLDFFSLARGYGLSLGFMLASIYYMLRGNIRTYDFRSYLKDFACSMLMATLAVYSNLSLINYFIAALFIFVTQYLWMIFTSSGFSGKKHLIFASVIILCLIPLYLSIKRLLLLSELQQLYFGVDSLKDTLYSIVVSSMYFGNNPTVATYITYSIPMVFLAGVLFVIFRKEFHGSLFRIVILIGVIIFGLLLENRFFGGKYPVERTAIFFLPLLALFLFYFIVELIKIIKKKSKLAVSIILFLFISLPLTYNLVTNINFKYTYTWTYDAHTKDIIKIIQESINYSQDKDRKYTISNNWLFEPSLNYYISSRNLNFEPTNRDGINSNSDFLYEFTSDHNEQNFRSLIDHRDIGTSLYQKITNN